MKTGPVKRRYDASRREAEARRLRRDIAAAARGVFVERGYATSTIADVASAANVSTQLVFKAFGSKAGLLAKVIDWTLADDDEPIPMAERPSVLAVRQEPTAAGKCALQARHARLVAARIADTIGMLRAAADADTEARTIYETGEHHRRTAAGHFVADVAAVSPLPAGITVERATDAVWALAPDVIWTMLVVRCGWTPDQFEQHYAALLATSLLDASLLPAVHSSSQQQRDRRADPSD